MLGAEAHRHSDTLSDVTQDDREARERPERHNKRDIQRARGGLASVGDGEEGGVNKGVRDERGTEGESEGEED